MEISLVRFTSKYPSAAEFFWGQRSQISTNALCVGYPYLFKLPKGILTGSAHVDIKLF